MRLLFQVCALLLLWQPASAEELRLGALFPLSGFAAEMGQSELNATTMAVEEINRGGGIAGRQNSYYDQLSGILLSQLAAGGAVVPEVVEIMPGQSDFRSIISRLKRADAVVVLFIGIGSETGIFLRQAREQKLQARFLSGHNILFDEAVNADRSLADGVVLFEYYANADAAFLERYRKRFGAPPLYSAPMAYDNVFLLKHAFERCGFAPAAARECLQHTDYRGVSGPIRFTAARQREGAPAITRLLRGEKGAYVPLTEW